MKKIKYNVAIFVYVCYIYIILQILCDCKCVLFEHICVYVCSPKAKEERKSWSRTYVDVCVYVREN